jgi:hypothetical protein
VRIDFNMAIKESELPGNGKVQGWIFPLPGKSDEVVAAGGDDAGLRTNGSYAE